MYPTRSVFMAGVNDSLIVKLNELKHAGLGFLLTITLGLLQSLYKDLFKNQKMHRHLCA